MKEVIIEKTMIVILVIPRIIDVYILWLFLGKQRLEPETIWTKVVNVSKMYY